MAEAYIKSFISAARLAGEVRLGANLNPTDNLLLDLYPNAVAALSVRKLNSNYSGNCIRIRRSSDNAETDIGFVNNYIDTASMLTFVGGSSNDGFVVKWYDQSGNGNDFSQSNAANQPFSVLNGTLITEGSKFAIDFDNDFIQSPSALITSNVWDIFSVSNIGAQSSDEFLLCQYTTGTTGRVVFLLNQGSSEKATIFFSDGSGRLGVSTQNANQYALISSYAKNDDYFLQVNNNDAEEVLSNLPFVPQNEPMRIGAGPAGISDVFGSVQEIIVYASNQNTNRNSIRTSINDYYSIY